MSEYNYNIVLRTLLGARNGTMQLLIDGETVNGVLSVLDKEQPVYGTIDQTGLCNLSGKIVTLLKEFAYTATGHIDTESVDLLLKSGKNTFQMNGTIASIRED